MGKNEIEFNNAIELLRSKVNSIENEESRNMISSEVENSIREAQESINKNSDLHKSNPMIMEMFYGISTTGINGMITTIDDMLANQKTSGKK